MLRFLHLVIETALPILMKNVRVDWGEIGDAVR